MAKEARELEAFLKGIEGQEDHAKQAGELARQLETDGVLKRVQATPKIELPADIRRIILKSDPMGSDEFAKAYKDIGIQETSYAQDFNNCINFSGKPQEIEIVLPSGRDLGLRRASPHRRFLEAGQAAGLHKLHPEVGRYLRLQDTDQPLGDVYWMAMDPISNRNGHPLVLVLEHRYNGLWLSTTWVHPAVLWNPGRRLAFGLTASETLNPKTSL